MTKQIMCSYVNIFFVQATWIHSFCMLYFQLTLVFRSQGLPTRFCSKHLPKNDTGIVLEDENGQGYQTLYLGAKQGLSAGWRGFALKHNIKVGDVVVFHLVRSTKFKVSPPTHPQCFFVRMLSVTYS